METGGARQGERAETRSRQGQGVFGNGLNSGRWRQISLPEGSACERRAGVRASQERAPGGPATCGICLIRNYGQATETSSGRTVKVATSGHFG